MLEKNSRVRKLNLAQTRPDSFRMRKWADLIGDRFLGHTGRRKTLEEFPRGPRAGSACFAVPKNEHEKTLQTLICKVFLWSIGESNPVSLRFACSVRFAIVICHLYRSADSFAHQASTSLSPTASSPLGCRSVPPLSNAFSAMTGHGCGPSVSA